MRKYKVYKYEIKTNIVKKKGINISKKISTRIYL